MQELIAKLKGPGRGLILLRIMLYPLSLLVTGPVQLIRTVFGSLSQLTLFSRSTTPHFCPHASVNNLFYWNRALNFKRYGRNGVSPILGLGDYNLSSLFHFSLPSLYGYWIGGVTFVLGTMLLWGGAFAVWLIEVDLLFVAYSLCLILCSSTFYANTFYAQNYNAWGWACLPIAIFGILTGHYYLAGIAWLVASLGSFTVVFMGAFLCLIQSVVGGELGAIISIVPACAKLGFHFVPLVVGKKGGDAISRRVRAIGMTRKNVKYERPARKISLVDVYHLGLVTQLAIVYYLRLGEIPWMIPGAMMLYVMNARFVRYADFQSTQLLLATISASYLIASGDWIVIASAWLAISPIPVGIVNPFRKDLLDVFPVMRPTNLKPLLDNLEQFLAPIQPGQKILLAFPPPENEYLKLFNGYRAPMEALNYAAVKKESLMLPSFESVFQLNFEGAPDFWVTDPAQSREKLQEWEADYLVVQVPNDGLLPEAYGQVGYEHLTTFKWTDHPDVWAGIINFVTDDPLIWYLLKKPQKQA